MVMEETRWGAVSPGSEWSISTIRADFVSFTSKSVRISPNLLAEQLPYHSYKNWQLLKLISNRQFLGVQTHYSQPQDGNNFIHMGTTLYQLAF
jgi:hypothetical protein